MELDIQIKKLNLKLQTFITKHQISTHQHPGIEHPTYLANKQKSPMHKYECQNGVYTPTTLAKTGIGQSDQLNSKRIITRTHNNKPQF